MKTDTPHLLHDITNCICAVVGAADTLAAHHDDLTPEQREQLAACMRRQSDVLRTLLGSLREADVSDGLLGAVQRPDPRDVLHPMGDLVSFDRGAVVLELSDHHRG